MEGKARRLINPIEITALCKFWGIQNDKNDIPIEAVCRIIDEADSEYIPPQATLTGNIENIEVFLLKLRYKFSEAKERAEEPENKNRTIMNFSLKELIALNEILDYYHTVWHVDNADSLKSIHEKAIQRKIEEENEKISYQFLDTHL